MIDYQRILKSLRYVGDMVLCGGSKDIMQEETEEGHVKESVYLDTSVASYYTSRPSRDIIVLAHQEITRQWWHKAINRYNVFISEVVIEEAGFGDPDAAKRRLEELIDFPHLELNDVVEEMAKICMERLDIPEKSFRDAAHLAVVSVHDVDYLVTWNCTHLANGEVIKKLVKINESSGIHTPIICTPEGLMEV